MDRPAFSRAVAALSVGKRLPDGVYAHVAALPHLPAELRNRARRRRLGEQAP